jgi:hypothetical protein
MFNIEIWRCQTIFDASAYKLYICEMFCFAQKIHLRKTIEKSFRATSLVAMKEGKMKWVSRCRIRRDVETFLQM